MKIRKESRYGSSKRAVVIPPRLPPILLLARLTVFIGFCGAPFKTGASGFSKV